MKNKASKFLVLFACVFGFQFAFIACSVEDENLEMPKTVTPQTRSGDSGGASGGGGGLPTQTKGIFPKDTINIDLMPLK